MKYEDQLDRFRSQLRSHGYSEDTVGNYHSAAVRFAGFIERYYPRITSFSKVTRGIVSDYQRFLATLKRRDGLPLANKTQGLLLVGLRKLYSFLLAEDLILSDPTVGITLPREEQRLVRNIMTEEQVLEVLRRTEPRDPIRMRNRAILELLYSCGIRTKELCDLTIPEVDLAQQTITIVNGKGGKSRFLPLGQYACHYIGLYLEQGRRRLLKGKPDDPGNLFLSSHGNQLDRKNVSRLVLTASLRGVDLDKHISLYSFRHSIASHLLARGVDVSYIAQLLGHASLQTTQRYLRIEIGDLKRMHSLHHPRERDHSSQSQSIDIDGDEKSVSRRLEK